VGDRQLWDRVVAGHFVLAKRSFWPNFFSQIVARLQWNPMAIDLEPDARAWPELPAERRRRLTTLLAGFCVAEDAVAEELTPFADAAREATLASQESLMAWVFFLQRRDEQRHARLFDRIGADVLGLPGATPAERRAAARAYVPAAFLELFEERLPAMAAELAAGRTGLSEGIGLYHMLLEGVVFDAGQHALLDDLADVPALVALDARGKRGQGRPPAPRRRAQGDRRGGVEEEQAATRVRTRAASRGAERRPSAHAAERTPAMSAAVSRTTGRSSVRRAPASAT
jgi:hypothetical protein